MNTRLNILLIFAILLFLSSCLKNDDQTDVGPKSQVAVVQVSFNTPAVDLMADNNKLTSAPIAFGFASGAPGNIYLPIQAGIRELKLLTAANTIFDKNQAFDATQYYTLIIFDTLRNNLANVGVIADDTSTIDTSGKARFFHFIPGNDSLSAILVKKDTSFTLATNAVYPSVSSTFPTVIKPGNYMLQLKKGATIIYTPTDSITINARSLYSFIAKGTTSGVGSFTPSVMILQNK